jgi:hypothetical protein
MSRLLRLPLILLVAGFSGCATTEPPKQDDRVSNIPWARPESWEGQGAFGGMLQGNR